MWIVKLGGSLAADPRLGDWLAMLADCGRGRVVVVPGGGPFAQQVRQAQAHWRFGDGAAHRMAILAMEQYGLMLADLQPGLVAGSSQEALYAALRGGNVGLWLPSAMLADTPEISAEVSVSWDVTSDSLAAWLARRLNAPYLVLVKSCALPQGEVAAEELAQLGIVDSAFPEFVRRGCFAPFVLHKDEPQRLRRMLTEENPAARR